MMLLPGWITAHESTVEADVIIVCTSARIGEHHGGRVQVIRAGCITYDQPCAGETRARELFEKVVEAHENGEELP